ncbi:MAG: ExeA family protein [Vicinamibacterales bacterium]
MYEDFFGLRERPFDLSPNPQYLFLTGRQREALSNLHYGLSVRRGFALLLGDAGTGKTTLLRTALAELDAPEVDYVLISNPTLSRDEFYEALATGFRLDYASKTGFLRKLEARLQQSLQENRVCTLVIDEAQSLPNELLEEVRLLSNIETDTTKLLNVVLVGQPELAERLNRSDLRQLKQRISLRCELRPFDLNETAGYIATRLRLAGGTPAGIFTREAVRVIAQSSAGIPRTINVLCDNALISGFAASEKPVGVRIVEEVCRDFDLKPQPPPAVGDASRTSPGAPDAPAPGLDRSDATEPRSRSSVQPIDSLKRQGQRS